MKNHCLARSIADVSWSQTIEYTSYKAENAGKKMLKVRPNFTSQDCSNCGNRQKMPLELRLYECSNCHISIGRDLNAAINIKTVGLNSLGNQSLEATSKPCLVVE
jgi:putative transposase